MSNLARLLSLRRRLKMRRSCPRPGNGSACQGLRPLWGTPLTTMMLR